MGDMHLNHPELTKANRAQMKQLIDHLLNSVLAGSVRRRNLIINEVPPGLTLTIDENLLAMVMGSLLNDVVNHTENDCIRISSAEGGKLITIRLKSNTISYDKTFAMRLEAVQSIMQGMGGLVIVRNHDDLGTELEVNLGIIKAA